MNDKIYSRMLLRRRFWKRIGFMTIVFVISFYISLLLFGDFKTPRVMYLTELDRCPACYGVNVCPALYSNQITLESHTWSSIFNVKNIYYGYTKTKRRIVLKKLAHSSELKDFDSKLCSYWNLKKTCKPMNLLNVSNLDEKIINLVEYNLTTPVMEPRKGLILCPYPYSIYDLVNQGIAERNGNYNSEMLNVWTMLKINPEPIILQTLSKSQGWPVPAYGGVCGRLEVVGYEGEPLSDLLHIAWHRKLKHARKILDAAMDFTFKHDRFRFYIMDWSTDNIVANERDEVTFVDLEDVIILDKHISPKKDLPHWYQRYIHDIDGPGFVFSIENMCKHHLSDHNIWAACYVLAGEEAYLYPIPSQVNASRPHLDKLLNKCLNGDDRFSTVTKLQHVIDDLLNDVKLVHYGIR